MLAASYDTDQASDPPTPRGAPQRPQAADVEVPLSTAGDAGEGADPAAASAGKEAEPAAAAEPAVSAAAGAADAQPAAVALAPQQELQEPAAAGRPSEAALETAAAAAPPPPPATQAIMAKLVDFVKVRRCPGPRLSPSKRSVSLDKFCSVSAASFACRCHAANFGKSAVEKYAMCKATNMQQLAVPPAIHCIAAAAAAA